MSRNDRQFAMEMIEEGFDLIGSDFLQGPAVPAEIHGQPCLVRTCYTYENYRWEGFASIVASTPELDALVVAQ